jgi:hypothetical protein
MIIAKVWGPCIVVSLGLGGACADAFCGPGKKKQVPDKQYHNIFSHKFDLLNLHDLQKNPVFTKLQCPGKELQFIFLTKNKIAPFHEEATAQTHCPPYKKVS